MKVQTRFITATEAKVLAHMFKHKRAPRKSQSILKGFESGFFIEIDGIDNIYISQVAKDLFISEKTVRNCITFLVKKDILRRHKKGNFGIAGNRVYNLGSSTKIVDSIIINHE